VLLACGGLLLLPRTLGLEGSSNFSIFITSAVIGGILVRLIVRNRLSVFIHEFKHYIVSNLAGNRSKGMVYMKRSGHFIYQYRKDTAHLNAFIALAPYVLPIFSLTGIILGLGLWRNEPILLAISIGLGFGADQLLNWREVSPVQSDISNIRGGFIFGLTYIVAFNIVTFIISSVLATHGVEGLAIFGKALLSLGQSFISTSTM
jgi:small-conductance mechanosensitive channel